MKEIDYVKYKDHTPGPWRAAMTDNYMRLYMPGPLTGDVARGYVGKANAALIADAPILLARCQELEEERDRFRQTWKERAQETVDLEAQRLLESAKKLADAARTPALRRAIKDGRLNGITYVWDLVLLADLAEAAQAALKGDGQ